MISIGYCEDEQVQAQVIKEKIMRWAKEQHEAVQVKLYESAEAYLFDEEQQNLGFHLILLDISMKKMNGMELAKKIRTKDKRAVIVFVTSDPSYVFEGYEVEAYRYLMKPIQDEKLWEILDYVRNSLTGKCEKIIIVKVDNEQVRLDLDEILYVEVQGHYIQIHLCHEKTLCIKSSLIEILELINKEKTYCVPTHRSYAVSLAKIAKIGRKECVLLDGSVIPISRGAYHALNEAFIHYNMKGRMACD